MCGITFVLNKKGLAVDRQVIARANQALSHRGPDESSSFFFENVALGHTRLSIVDIKGGHQPLFNEDKSIVLICNGEIYNSPTLRDLLVSKGHRFSTHSDCEAIIHLYEEDPVNYPQQLAGMFSFVLLDTKRKLVHIARDRVGIKPLCWFEDANYFACSSEIKGLLATGLTPREFDRQAICDSFTFGYIPGERTSFSGIKHFAPATICSYELETKKRSERQYWYLTFPKRSNKDLWRYREYVSNLRSGFQQAIASHMIGEVPMGAYLSGGIDSTITSTLLHRILGKDQQLKTFSIKFTVQEFDESDSFLQSVKKLRFDSHVLEMDSLDSGLFQQVIYHIEQPQFSPMDGPMFLLSKLVQENGIKVVCIGEGSDELFGGYSTYTLNQARRVLSLPSLQALKPLLLEKVLRYYIPPSELREMYLHTYLADQSAVIKLFGHYPPWYPGWLINSQFKKPLFDARYQDSLAEGSAMQNICAVLRSKSDSPYAKIDEFDKGIYLEMKTRLPNYILHRGDRNSMAHGVEARVPFLDNDVIELAAQVPPVFKMFGFKEKFILRQAFKSVLPKHILKRRKYGFNAPNTWLWGKKDERIETLLSEAAIKKSNIFDVQGVEQYKKEISSGGLSPLSLRYNFILNTLTGVLSTQMLQASLIEKDFAAKHVSTAVEPPQPGVG